MDEVWLVVRLMAMTAAAVLVALSYFGTLA